MTTVLVTSWVLAMGLWFAAIVRISTAHWNIEIDAADRIARMARAATKIAGVLSVLALIAWAASSWSRSWVESWGLTRLCITSTTTRPTTPHPTSW